MPVEVELLRNDRLVVYTWADPVSNDDFTGAFDSVAPLYRETTRPIHSIQVAYKVTNLPPNVLGTVLRMSNSPLVHPMSGTVVVVTTNSFVRTMVQTAAKLRRKGKLQVTATLDDALAKIDQILLEETSYIDPDQFQK